MKVLIQSIGSAAWDTELLASSQVMLLRSRAILSREDLWGLPPSGGQEF